MVSDHFWPQIRIPRQITSVCAFESAFFAPNQINPKKKFESQVLNVKLAKFSDHEAPFLTSTNDFCNEYNFDAKVVYTGQIFRSSHEIRIFCDYSLSV